MASPILSAPTLYTPSDLRADPALVTEITDLINDAFYRSKLQDPVKWRQARGRRFPTHDLYFEMLGQDGVVVAIFDKDDRKRKVVAVAAAVPWAGGWKQEGAGSEDGWEIKAVAVDGSEQYLRRGLAVQMYTFLEQYLVAETKKSGRSTTGRRMTEKDCLTFWILAAECINGAYWRKRGYELVRKDIYGPPTWGCQTEFEMIVLKKDVPLDVSRFEHSVQRKAETEELSRRRTVEAN